MALTTPDMNAIRSDLDITGQISMNDPAVRFRSGVKAASGVYEGQLSLNDMVGKQGGWQPNIDPIDYGFSGTGFANIKRYQTQFATYDPRDGGAGIIQSETYCRHDSITDLGYANASQAPSEEKNGLNVATVKGIVGIGDKSIQLMYFGILPHNSVHSGWRVSIDFLEMTKHQSSSSVYTEYDLNIFAYRDGFASGSSVTYQASQDIQSSNKTGFTSLGETSTTWMKKYDRSFTVNNTYPYVLVTVVAIMRSGANPNLNIPKIRMSDVRITSS